MAVTYFVSPDGSNANNGLGPDASHATNKPWLTVGKAVNSGTPVVAGDTVYVAPGYYYSEQLTPISTIASVGSPTQIIGDPTNAQGFKDSGGVRRAPGIPWVTTRTAAEGLDARPASVNNLILCNGGTSPSGVQFKNLMLEAKSTQQIYVGSYSVASDILFEDCVMWGGSLFSWTAAGTPTAGRNFTLRRCILMSSSGSILTLVTASAAATADADLGILLEECFCFGALSTSQAIGTAGGNLAGGVTFKDCTVFPIFPFLSTVALRCSTVAPIRYQGCLFIGGSAMNAGTLGHIVDDGANRTLNGAGGYTNVTTHATTLFNVAPNIVMPHLVKWGLELPRFDMFGWTDAAVAVQKFSASGLTSPDFRGRTARPWGAGASSGCFQVPDVALDTGSAITGGGANSLKLTGAGEVSLWVPVDAAATTVSVVTKSVSYGGASYPQLIVVANPSLGITADQVVTAASATEAQITSPSFTPTAKGVVELRLVSRSSSVSSSTYFDLVTSP